MHHGRGDRPTSGYFNNPTVTEDWPDDEDLQRAHVQSDRGRWYCKGWAEAILTNEENDNLQTTFHAMIDTMGPTERYLMENVEASEEDITVIAESLRRGKVRMVSDGSFFKHTKIATFDVRIENDEKTHMIKAKQFVPGNPEFMDSYRAECAGLLAGFIILSTLCKYEDIDEGGAKVGCDGKSALDMAFREVWDARSSDKHFDMIYVMQSWYRKIPLRLKRHWIKGHQDEKIPFRRLDRMSQLNVLCDESAKALGRQLPTSTIPSEIHLDLWRLEVGGKTVVHNVEVTLREWIHDPKLK